MLRETVSDGESDGENKSGVSNESEDFLPGAQEILLLIF